MTVLLADTFTYCLLLLLSWSAPGYHCCAPSYLPVIIYIGCLHGVIQVDHINIHAVHVAVRRHRTTSTACTLHTFATSTRLFCNTHTHTPASPQSSNIERAVLLLLQLTTSHWRRLAPTTPTHTSKAPTFSRPSQKPNSQMQPHAPYWPASSPAAATSTCSDV